MKGMSSAGKPAQPAALVNVAKLVAAYYSEAPEATVPAQQVAFGTSGHRGSALENSLGNGENMPLIEAIFQRRTAVP